MLSLFAQQSGFDWTVALNLIGNVLVPFLAVFVAQQVIQKRERHDSLTNACVQLLGHCHEFYLTLLPYKHTSEPDRDKRVSLAAQVDIARSRIKADCWILRTVAGPIAETVIKQVHARIFDEKRLRQYQLGTLENITPFDFERELAGWITDALEPALTDLMRHHASEF